MVRDRHHLSSTPTTRVQIPLKITFILAVLDVAWRSRRRITNKKRPGCGKLKKWKKYLILNNLAFHLGTFVEANSCRFFLLLRNQFETNKEKRNWFILYLPRQGKKIKKFSIRSLPAKIPSPIPTVKQGCFTFENI